MLAAADQRCEALYGNTESLQCTSDRTAGATSPIKRDVARYSRIYRIMHWNTRAQIDRCRDLR